MNVEFDSSELTLTEADIRRFEEEVGVKLPQDYLECLLKNNGGVPRPADFKHKALGEDVVNCVTGFFPLRAKPGRRDLREAWREARQELPQGFLPFGRDLGGELLCLCLKPEDYGSVHRSDGFVEDIGCPVMMHRLANSFSTFLEMLFDEEAG